MRIAVVASGWHFPLHFYESISKQVLPEHWEMDLFCVSHRDPKYAVEEKKDKTFPEGLRGDLDRNLYEKMATIEDIEGLGWKYKEYPNTVGDWGNSNQWLEENDWKQYDLFLFTHDDNLIIHDRVIADAIEDPEAWDIRANTLGMPAGMLRGSFEFFKPKVLRLLDGKFDLSLVTLSMEGKTTVSENTSELYDWNNTVLPLMAFIKDNNLKVTYFSPCYRVSAYCIEGERGYISNTHGANTENEEVGLAFLHENHII